MKYISTEYAGFLKGIYKQPNYLPSSGWALSRVKEAVEKIAATYMPLEKKRAEMFAVTVKNMRFALDDDYFADRFDYYKGLYGGSFLQETRTELLNAVVEKYPEKELVQKCRQGNLFWATHDFSHISPHWERLFSLGITGIISEAEENKKQNPQGATFYDGVITVYSAIRDLLRKMADIAEKTEGKKVKILARSLRSLAMQAPQTLHEILQLTLVVYVLINDVEGHIVRSFGNADVLWKKYYENDLKTGAFSQEQLDELIAAFFLRVSEMNNPWNLPIAIGTPYEDGTKYDWFSERLIDIYASLNIYSPKIHVKYNDHLPEKLALKVCRGIVKGNSSYVFINDEIVRAGLEKYGIKRSETDDYLVVGCYEPIANGLESCSTCNGYINVQKCVEYAMFNGYDHCLQAQVGLNTGVYPKTFDSFLAAVFAQLKFAVQKTLQAIVYYEENYPNITSSPVLSATYAHAMQKGQDLYYGGAKYNNSGVNIIGMATAVDSLSVIKRFIYEDKEYSLAEFSEILKKDWKDNEKLRLRCSLFKERYGNNLSQPDHWMVEIYDYISELINNKPNGRGGVFKTGYFSIDRYMLAAKNVLASADGRHTHDFISKNITASSGKDIRGITALIHSLNKIDYTKCANGCVFDFMVHPSTVSGKDGLHVLYALIRTYLDNGGFAIQGNVFNHQILEEAQKNPEQYRSLQVRVCGWNALFHTLSEREQNVFIENAKRRSDE